MTFVKVNQCLHVPPKFSYTVAICNDRLMSFFCTSSHSVSMN